jgi:hypothetical protein
MSVHSRQKRFMSRRNRTAYLHMQSRAGGGVEFRTGKRSVAAPKRHCFVQGCNFGQKSIRVNSNLSLTQYCDSRGVRAINGNCSILLVLAISGWSAMLV